LKLFDNIDDNYKKIYFLLSRKKIEKYEKKSFKNFLIEEFKNLDCSVSVSIDGWIKKEKKKYKKIE
jgi:hypothetical protein